jgi:adenine-specific DNA methylase
MSRFTPMSHQVKCPTCGQVYPLVALATHIQTDHPTAPKERMKP